MNRPFVTIATTVALITASNVGTAAETAPAKKPAASTSLNAIDRGKYMLIVGGCNDCHTADFAARSGDVPEREWLKGSGKLGFSGSWGTTYRSNSSAPKAEARLRCQYPPSASSIAVGSS